MARSMGSSDESQDSGFKISDVPSFLEARDPSITNPWMRRRPTHGTNLDDLLEEVDLSTSPKVQCIEVYLRIKPINEDVSDIYKLINETTLETALPCKLSKIYNFTNIFEPTVSQKQIFDCIVRANIHKLIEGHNYTLLTYGTSGSGKTFTLIGTELKPGLLPRSLELLFQLINPSSNPRYKPLDGSGFEYLSPAQQASEIQIQNKMKKVQTTATHTYGRMSVRLSSIFEKNKPETNVWVSYAEIYNEAITDLLEPRNKSANLKIVEDTKGNSFIRGLKKVYIQSGLEAYQVMLYGQKNLTYAKTGINAHSSRSHSIFTIMLVKKWPGCEQPTISFLRLCDLAGSERNKKTGNLGKRLQESCSINMSLYVLERCLEQLRARQNATLSSSSNSTTMNSSQPVVVPFRESKLTRLLSAALSGKENAAMVVNINPQRNFFEETQHVLQFSAVARKLVVINHLESGRISPATSVSSCELNALTEDLMHYKNENLALREELERIRMEAENMAVATADAREREVRMELGNAMRQLLDRSIEGWQRQLQDEQEYMKHAHANEVQDLKDEYLEVINNLNSKIEELRLKLERPSECNNIYIKQEVLRKSQSPGTDAHIIAGYKKMIESLQKDFKQSRTQAAIYKEEMDTLETLLVSSRSNYAALSERFVNLEEAVSNPAEVSELSASNNGDEASYCSENDINDGDDENDSDAVLYNSDSEEEASNSVIMTVKKKPPKISLDKSGIVLLAFGKSREQSCAKDIAQSIQSDEDSMLLGTVFSHSNNTSDRSSVDCNKSDMNYDTNIKTKSTKEIKGLNRIASFCHNLCENLKETSKKYGKELNSTFTVENSSISSDVDNQSSRCAIDESSISINQTTMAKVDGKISTVSMDQQIMDGSMDQQTEATNNQHSLSSIDRVSVGHRIMISMDQETNGTMENKSLTSECQQTETFAVHQSPLSIGQQTLISVDQKSTDYMDQQNESSDISEAQDIIKCQNKLNNNSTSSNVMSNISNDKIERNVINLSYPKQRSENKAKSFGDRPSEDSCRIQDGIDNILTNITNNLNISDKQHNNSTFIKDCNKRADNKSLDFAKPRTRQTKKMVSLETKGLNITPPNTSKGNVIAGSTKRVTRNTISKKTISPAEIELNTTPNSDVVSSLGNRRVTRNNAKIEDNQVSEENSLTNTGRRKLWARRTGRGTMDLFLDPERSPDLPLEAIKVTRPSYTPRTRRNKK